MVLRTLHIVGIIFGIIMLVITFLLYNRKKFTFNSLVFWLIIWIGFIAGIISFEKFRHFTESMSVRPFDFFVLIALLVIFAVLFLQYKDVKETQQKMAEVVQEIALREGKRK